MLYPWITEVVLCLKVFLSRNLRGSGFWEQGHQWCISAAFSVPSWFAMQDCPAVPTLIILAWLFLPQWDDGPVPSLFGLQRPPPRLRGIYPSYAIQCCLHSTVRLAPLWQQIALGYMISWDCSRACEYYLREGEASLARGLCCMALTDHPFCLPLHIM